MKKYTAIVNMISGSQLYYPEFEAKNKKVAKTKVMIDRQKKGDEMFIKSIKIEIVK